MVRWQRRCWKSRPDQPPNQHMQNSGSLLFRLWLSTIIIEAQQQLSSLHAKFLHNCLCSNTGLLSFKLNLTSRSKLRLKKPKSSDWLIPLSQHVLYWSKLRLTPSLILTFAEWCSVTSPEKSKSNRWFHPVQSQLTTCLAKSSDHFMELRHTLRHNIEITAT